MNLFSIEFIILLMVLLLVYYIVPGKLQWLCLLTASLIFYAASGVKNLLFIGVTSVSIWLAGMARDLSTVFSCSSVYLTAIAELLFLLSPL